MKRRTFFAALLAPLVAGAAPKPRSFTQEQLRALYAKSVEPKYKLYVSRSTYEDLCRLDWK
jgi:hypothetical protein